jgi:hypothetical protein
LARRAILLHRTVHDPAKSALTLCAAAIYVHAPKRVMGVTKLTIANH